MSLEPIDFVFLEMFVLGVIVLFVLGRINKSSQKKAKYFLERVYRPNLQSLVQSFRDHGEATSATLNDWNSIRDILRGFPYRWSATIREEINKINREIDQYFESDIEFKISWASVGKRSITFKPRYWTFILFQEDSEGRDREVGRLDNENRFTVYKPEILQRTFRAFQQADYLLVMKPNGKFEGRFVRSKILDYEVRS